MQERRVLGLRMQEQGCKSEGCISICKRAKDATLKVARAKDAIRIHEQDTRAKYASRMQEKTMLERRMEGKAMPGQQREMQQRKMQEGCKSNDASTKNVFGKVVRGKACIAQAK